jgi:hypothetical protein
LGSRFFYRLLCLIDGQLTGFDAIGITQGEREQWFRRRGRT